MSSSRLNDQDLIRLHADQLRNFLEAARSTVRPPRPEVTERALHEIELTVEELNVAEEELRVQHEELIAMNHTLDLERERYRALFDEAPDPYLETDKAGTIRSANRAAAHLFGLRQDRLHGKPLLLYIPADDHREFFARLEAISTARDSLPATFEVRIMPRASEMRLMQARVDVHASEARVLWLLRDITVRKRADEAERQLRVEHAMRIASEAMVRQERFLADASDALAQMLDLDEMYQVIAQQPVPYLCDACAVDIVTLQGEIQRVAAHGASAESLALLDYLVPAKSGSIEEALTTGEPQMAELQAPGLPTESASDLTVPTREALRDASGLVLALRARGRTLGTISMVRSDPERSCGRDLIPARAYADRASFALDNVRLLREASAAREGMSNMVRMLSHEFRTPLSSVLGYADLLLSGIGATLDEKQTVYVRNLRSSAWHLGRLVDDVLVTSRHAQAGDIPHSVVIDITTMLADVRSVLQPEADRKGVTLEVDTDIDQFETDIVKLRQILLNLAGNALKFTDHGAVRLHAEPRMGGMEITVQDTGRGMSSDELAHIFEEFWQAGYVKTGGIGLGLSLTRNLARLLGGSVTAESESGQGSTFKVWLPPLPVSPPVD